MDVRYVKDEHGHVYIYIPAYENRLGVTLFDCPEPDRSVIMTRLNALTDITALQEAAAQLGCNIPDSMKLSAARKFVEAHLFP